MAGSAWTPIIFDLSEYSSILNDLVEKSLDQLWSEPGSLGRTKISAWKNQMKEQIGTHEKNRDLIKGVYGWLTKCTAKPVDDISEEETLEAFLEVQLLMKSKESEAAKRVLAHLQVTIESHQLDRNHHQYFQHSFIQDATMDLLNVDFLIQATVDDPGDFDANLSVQDQSFLQSPMQSPPRKRSKAEHSTTPMELSFAEFDSLPVYARGAPKWNHLLAANPTFWISKCESWYQALQAAFQERTNSEHSKKRAEELYDSIVDCLREMRQVRPSIYKTSGWKNAVKLSKLPEIVDSWSNPNGLFKWTAIFIIRLMRSNRIHESLLLVLYDWIPEVVQSGWPVQPTLHQFQKNPSNKIQNWGKYLYSALLQYPKMIPRLAYPSSIFFLLNVSNFAEAGAQWLGSALEMNGKNASFLNTKEETNLAYRQLKSHLENVAGTDFARVEDFALKIIFQRTVEFGRIKKQVSENIFKNRISGGKQTPCSICSNGPEELKCVKKLFVKKKTLEDKYLGCGVSFASAQNVDAIPVQNQKNSNGEQFVPRSIIHPEDLGLKPIVCNPQIIQKCGSMIFEIYDANNEESMLDFWIYGAFPQIILNRLVSHHHELQNLKAINRGRQFNSYSQGQMFGRGARSAMGGMRGDAFVFYQGMDADQAKGIQALFNDAEDSMVLHEVARILDFSAYNSLKEATEDGDKLGVFGATLYTCKNYASPLHRDDDISPGICAQYQLQAKKNLSEYAFIYADYGIYFVSQSNSLWSFSGSTTHGTMLPSNIPLEHKDVTILAPNGQPWPADEPPPRVSNGTHVSATKSNCRAARKYQKVRNARQNISDYWSQE